MDDLGELLALQDGVIARHQALAAGLSPVTIARLVRRREWTLVHPGVYVDHTGPLIWRQRAWAAVLALWPAALDGWSAIRAHEAPGRRGADDDVVHVVVAHSRRVADPAGVDVRRSRRFDQLVQWNLSPPRLRYDDAVIDLADRARTELRSIAILADACGKRRTSARRLRARLDETPRLRRRSWLLQVLDDVAEGTCSVLEQGYLALVERPHGLPRGTRQAEARADGRRMFRDVLYRGRRPVWSQIVELDGRIFHESPEAHDRDLERDLDAALERQHTVRIGYGQVFERPCQTAAKMGRLLQLRGWRGQPVRCPRCPPGSAGSGSRG